MTDEQITALVARLRRAGPFYDPLYSDVIAGYRHLDYRDSHEAASALELHQQTVEAINVSRRELLKRAEAAEARAERLAGALRSIAANTCCDRCQEAALVARAALREPGEGGK